MIGEQLSISYKEVRMATVPGQPTETKPGYQTSEFWLMVFGVAVNFINVAGIWDFISNWHSGILMTVIMAAYKVSRGEAKKGVAYVPPTNRA
jgi:hypothetical protein